MKREKPEFPLLLSYNIMLQETDPGILTRLENVLLTWSNHDLVLLGADSQEGEVVLGVDVSHCAPGLHHQLVDQSSVLHCAGVVESRFDGDSCAKNEAVRSFITF